MIRWVGFLMAGAALAAQGQTTLIYEDFEDATVSYVSSIAESSDGDYDYFGRVGPGGIVVGSKVEFSNIQGSGYFAAQDMDAAPTPAPDARATLTWSTTLADPVTNIVFSGFFAEDDDGVNQDWDLADDFLSVEVKVGTGAWQEVLRFENDGSTFNSAPFEDTDFDGIGDGVELTSTFTKFTKAVSGYGRTIELRITIDLDSGDEDIAFDEIKVTGEPFSFSGPAPVQSVSATSAGAGSIHLSWEPNVQGHPVVVARAMDSTFGAPETGSSYQAGDLLPGRGEVIYAGGATSYADSGLAVDGEYFYRVWSMEGSSYSLEGVSASALASAYVEGIRILHVNDVHSRLTPHDYDITGVDDVPVLEKVGGAAYMAARVLELKAAYPGSVFVDAGDTSEGSVLGDLRSNGGVIDYYKELDRKLKEMGGRGLDASVVGNHDVRYGEMLTNMRACTNFPFISMNIIELATGEPYFKPYVTVVADGKKVGILGYTTDTSSHLGPETEAIVRVDKCGWDEGDIHIRDYVMKLRNEENCDVVILLMHVGHSRLATDGPNQYQLVKDDGSVDPPEVAIGGHWHTMTWTVWQPAILNYKTIIAEAASYMQYIGEIHLTDEGEYVDSAKHVIRCADITPDPDVEQVINNLIAEYNASPKKVYDLDQVFGYSAVDLRMNKNKWWTHNEFPWSGDHTAGAWISDSMAWYVETQTPHGCDLALQSGGGVRRDNAAGPLTYLEIYETYPWQDDNMVLIDATGAEIWSFIQADHLGTSISQGWEVFARDGIITNITYQGAPIGMDQLYKVAVSDFMYSYDNDFVPGGWRDTTPERLSHSIRQSVIDYTSQFGESNPMDVPGPRYHLNTGHSGRFQAVVTMVDDSDNYSGRQPYHESAYVRLLSATEDTVARRGGYVCAELVNEDGTINPAHQFSEGMLYRSYLGFKEGLLVPGTILNIQVESGFHQGNPQWVEQTGIIANGVEFDIVGTNVALAAPVYKESIDAFWDAWHANHYVLFEAEKVSANQVRDRFGRTISVYTEGAFDLKTLPGSVGDLLRLEGVQTYQSSERRFRCATVSVVTTAPATPDYAPYSSVIAHEPAVQGEGPLLLQATCSDLTQQRYYTLLPTDDAHVASGNPTSNYGTSTTLYLQSQNSGFGNKRILTTFDLSQIPAGATVESAELQLYCYGTAGSSNLVADLYAAASDAWQEETVTWAGQPGLGSLLDGQILKAGERYVWYGWDVSSFIAAEAAGDDLASMVLKPRYEDAVDAQTFRFNAKEYQSGRLGPYLSMKLSGGPEQGGWVTNLTFFYRYSADGKSWGGWSEAGAVASEPWALSFDYVDGYGWYEFYSVATDNTGRVEPAPLLADAAIWYTWDRDGDGVDDAWEMSWFGDLTTVTATSDADHDGFSDLHEFLAGTNPTDALDLLTVAFEQVPQNDLVIRWLSVTGRRYAVERSSSLTAGFTNRFTGVEATPPENVVTDRVENVESVFYRIRLED